MRKKTARSWLDSGARQEWAERKRVMAEFRHLPGCNPLSGPGCTCNLLPELAARVEALEKALQETAVHFHLAHKYSAEEITVPPMSTCQHPVCEAARKLPEGK